MSSDALKGYSPADLNDAIGQLHALGGGVLHAMFEAIRAYEQTEAWRGDGAGSMAAWVSYSLGVTTTTGADYVRVARAPAHLPAISAALKDGRLCYEQVRALVRVATPQNEAGLLEQAAGLTATQVEAMVRGLRAVTTEEAAGANRRRSLRLRGAGEDRTLRIYGRLPDVDGATFATAIERIADRSSAAGDDPDREPWDARCADALVELASCSLAADADADRAQVVVHIEAEALAQGEEGVATLECGVAAAPETVRRPDPPGDPPAGSKEPGAANGGPLDGGSLGCGSCAPCSSAGPGGPQPEAGAGAATGSAAVPETGSGGGPAGFT